VIISSSLNLDSYSHNSTESMARNTAKTPRTKTLTTRIPTRRSVAKRKLKSARSVKRKRRRDTRSTVMGMTRTLEMMLTGVVQVLETAREGRPMSTDRKAAAPDGARENTPADVSKRGMGRSRPMVEAASSKSTGRSRAMVGAVNSKSTGKSRAMVGDAKKVAMGVAVAAKSVVDTVAVVVRSMEVERVMETRGGKRVMVRSSRMALKACPGASINKRADMEVSKVAMEVLRVDMVDSRADMEIRATVVGGMIRLLC
jgi:hypothetical protein